MSEAPDMLAAALAYAERGWPVFLCSPRHSRPLIAADDDPATGKDIKGTGGFAKATCDIDQLRAWWKRWPKAMIGFATGRNGAFVLDFDPRVDPDTGEVWTLHRLKEELEAQLGCALPPTLAVQTPSGGVHAYFAMPVDGEPIRNRGNLLEHIDVRGLGGYVIAPPSRRTGDATHAAGDYRWLRGERGVPIGEPPPALVAILRARKPPAMRKAASSRGAQPVEYEDDDRVRRYALSALDAECQAVAKAPSGARQNALNTASFKVARLVSAGAIGEAAARPALRASALGNPGRDSEDQIDATLDSGWQAGLAKPRDLSAVVAAVQSVPMRSARSRGRTANDNPPLREDGTDLAKELCMRPMTDLGNAERFAARYSHLVRYVEKMGWMAYDGRRFILDGADALIGGWVQQTVRAIREEARILRDSGRRDLGDADGLDDLVETKRDDTEVLLSDKLAAWAKASESANRLGCIRALAKDLPSHGLTIQHELNLIWIFSKSNLANNRNLKTHFRASFRSLANSTPHPLVIPSSLHHRERDARSTPLPAPHLRARLIIRALLYGGSFA